MCKYILLYGGIRMKIRKTNDLEKIKESSTTTNKHTFSKGTYYEEVETKPPAMPKPRKK
ncbi:hypothetical protein TPELB_17950 [Terrisporobacter petrolearius]|uniref:Multidrug transporter n=1 Tax=Terrisporobacter petrolearius TaxID=1460447 RepID=A0ABZ3FFK2_9FIRM